MTQTPIFIASKRDHQRISTLRPRGSAPGRVAAVKGGTGTIGVLGEIATAPEKGRQWGPSLVIYSGFTQL